MKEVMISESPAIEFRKGAVRNLQKETTGAPIVSASPKNTKDIPHYLRASTGSCHDLCKFGIKHASEVKTARPVLPIRLSNSRKTNAMLDQIETGKYQQGKEKKELSSKISQKEVQLPDVHKVNKQMDLPPEKIIQISDTSTNLTKTYHQEPIESNNETGDKHLPSLREEESSEGSVSIKCMIPSSMLEDNDSCEHESGNPSEKPKAPIRSIRSPNMHNTPVSRAGGSSSEQRKTKKLSTGGKSKGGVNGLKNAQKRLGDIGRPEASKTEQADEVGLPNVKKTRPVFPSHLSNSQMTNAAHDEIEIGNYRQREEKKLRSRTSQKVVQPKQMDLLPENIIQISDSSTNITKTSDQEPTNLNDETSDKHLLSRREESSEGSVNMKSMVPPSLLEGNESCEHESGNPSEVLFDNNVNFNYNGIPTGSTVRCGENVTLIQEEKSSLETYVSPALENIESAEHAMDGSERSSDDTLSDRKLNTPERSTNASTKTKGNIDKSIEFDKHKPSGYLGGVRKSTSPRKSKAPIQRIRSPTMQNTPVSPAGGSSSEQRQLKRLSASGKSKGEVNKLKNAQKGLGDVDRPEASKVEQADEVGLPNVIKENIRETLEESVKSNTKTELKKNLSMKSTAASATLMMRKNSTLSAHGAVCASVESATSIKLRKVMLRSPCSSSSKELMGRRNQHKAAYITDQPKRDEEKVVKELSTPPSIKPRHTGASSLELKKIKNVSPFLTVKNQTKIGRSGIKEKTFHATKQMTEKIDLNAMKQKLRKSVSRPWTRKEEHDGSSSKANRTDKSTTPREFSRRNSRDFSSEFKRNHRRSASNQPAARLSKTLNFNRGKVVELQPEQTSPAWLRFSWNKKGAKSVLRRLSSGFKNYSSVAPAIVLKHADVQDKNVQALFNNVIEETASELAKSRKSKVKALIGAFETVISLQEARTPV